MKFEKRLNRLKFLAFLLSDPSFDTSHIAEQVKGSSIRLGVGTVTTPEERNKYLEMGVAVFQEAPKLPK